MKSSILGYKIIVYAIFIILGIGLIASFILPSLLEHKHKHKEEYVYNENNHWYICLCGEKIELNNHLFDSACDNSCNICDYIRIPKPHVFDNECDNSCNICNYIRIVNDHNYDINNRCKICGKSKQD